MAFFKILKKNSSSSKLDEVVEKHPDEPIRAWSILQVSQTVQKVEPMDPSIPKPPDHTRFVCISDTHSVKKFEHPIPDGDVLIHAGDFTMVGKMTEIREFKEFMASLSHPHKIFIAGNHDLLMHEDEYDHLYSYWGVRGEGVKSDPSEARKLLLDAPDLTYLEDSEVTVNGIRIYGSPWVPEFGKWAFMLPRGEVLKEKWGQIPDGIDILVTHGPPLGYGDLCFNQARAGCIHLLQAVQNRVKPKYHVFGHIHEGYGIWTNGVTTFVNASTTNIRYQLKHKPIVFDLPNK